MKDQVLYKTTRNIFLNNENKLRRGLVSFFVGLLSGLPVGVALLSSITEVFHG